MSSTSIKPKFDADEMDNETQDKIVEAARADDSIENTYSGVRIDTFEGEIGDLTEYHNGHHQSSLEKLHSGKAVLRLPRSLGL